MTINLPEPSQPREVDLRLGTDLVPEPQECEWSSLPGIFAEKSHNRRR